MRYKIIIEYDGTPFVGWQKQENGRSIQESIESLKIRSSAWQKQREEDIQKFGADYVSSLVQTLLNNDTPGIHFYTINKLEPTKQIIDQDKTSRGRDDER